jgi:hypothetical protein
LASAARPLKLPRPYQRPSRRRSRRRSRLSLAGRFASPHESPV